MKKIIFLSFFFFLSAQLLFAQTPKNEENWVTIGHPGNPAQDEDNRGHNESGTYGDPPFAINGDGLGAVGYTYRISKYAVSIADWEPFYGDGTSGIGGIGGGTAQGTFNATYNYWNDGFGGRSVGTSAPAIRISLHQAAQYANWLTTGNATQGAYTIDDDGRITAIDRTFRNEDGMLYAVSSLDEWYKAFAYNGATGMYSLYADDGNDKDNPPLKSTDGLTGWNYDNAGANWTTATTAWAVDRGTEEQNGTFNMMGNVYEWVEFDPDADYDWVPYDADAEVRGGRYNMGESHLRGYDYIPWGSETEAFTIGFRLVALGEGVAPGEGFYSREDGSWDTAATWSTVECGGTAATTIPDPADNAIICVGDVVFVDDPQTISGLTIAGSLDIQAGGALTVNDDITIESTGSESTGSVAVRSGGLFNNQTGTSIEFTAERDLATAGWTYLSSPVSGVHLRSFLAPTWTQGAVNFEGAGFEGGTPNVYRWNSIFDKNEPSGWLPVTDLAVPMTAGEGFLVGVFADSNFDGNPDLPHTLSVTGTEHGDVSIITNAAGGWTFIGNPYATAISFNELQTGTHITDAVYVWTPGDIGDLPTDEGHYEEPFEAGKWATFTIGSSGSGDLTDGRIAPFQAFFVENDGENREVSLTFDNTVKSGAIDTGNFIFKQKQKDVIRMELAGQGMRNSTWLTFSTDGTTDGRTSGDAWQLQPMSADYALLATEKQAGLMDIGHYPLGTEMNIPLVTDVTRAGTYTLTVTDIDLNGSELYLNDLERNISLRFTENLKYEFTINQTAKTPADPFAKIANGPLKASADSPARFTITTAPMESDNSEVPGTFALKQNYPNPFNPTTRITYELPQNSDVRLVVFDMAGRQVATLVDGSVNAGTHTVQFDAANLSSGVYIYRLQAGSTVLNRKLTLIK